MGLEGKVALITGAAAGIGAATARLFAQNGAQLSLIDMDEEGLEKVAFECTKSGAEVLTVICDVSLLKDIDRALAETMQGFGGLDILVNNAIYRAVKPCLEINEEEFDQSLFTNIKGYFFLAQKAVPHMEKRGEGRIINMASTFGFVGSPSLSVYCTCKGAVVNMTRALALELAPKNIYVNAVAPGPIMTEGMEVLVKQLPGVYEARIQDTPLGRYGTPEEVAEICLFLAGEKCSYMNGSVLVADGGFLTH